MNQGMSTPEFFGIFLAAAASVASVLFMMIASAAATARHFRVMLNYLRLAGMLSMASWVVMLAVMVRCEKICWVVKNKPLEATPVSQEHEYTVATPSGVSLKWRSGYVGVSRVIGHRGGSGREGGFVGSGG